MRKYEISCAIIIQNMAQLEKMYKESWKTIVGNCDEFIYLGGHESSSTEYVSKMLGKQTIKSRNSSRTYGRQGSSNISLNATGRELMTPDEIAHMSDQDCLVMVKGVMPFFDKKYALEKHPNFRYTGDWEDENHNTPPELIFNIADEIQTPNNKAFIPNYEGQYRDLKHQAMHDARNNERYAPIGKRHTRHTEINKENLEAAGFNNLFNRDDNLEPPKEPPIEVVSAHAPLDDYAVPSDIEAASEENFNNIFGDKEEIENNQ